ncbi:DNA primase subunit pri2 [Spiromyces aspiralis]|uniref:DNA primase subunit pri2 n=1 Tax=Spiromyces aspiralis TaxID=68401 RepID=A0ACC1HC70_9FUNG|nr:DNA primase subunit pri2 [Spiromyces aspiralis]
MAQLHTSLKADSHLRHFGRMQLGLFLKGIGLPLPEALIYWRRAFSRKFTDDQFQKSYAYNIRHNYGMEGRRTDYTPYSCAKIITTNAPGAGDHHGCPFRHAGAGRLKALLCHGGLGGAEAGEVAELARQGHYQVACTKYLELRLRQRRGGAAPAVALDGITHPNQYFDLSVGNGERARPGDPAAAHP